MRIETGSEITRDDRSVLTTGTFDGVHLGHQAIVRYLVGRAKKMGGVSPREFLRAKDAEKFDLPESASDEEVFAAMADNPKLIQRPIGVNGDKAILGRPNDKLLEIR